MMQKKNNEKKWIEQFQQCTLIDEHSRVFVPARAYQLFYGKQDESYRFHDPDGFNALYSAYRDKLRTEVISQTLRYLAFIGISLDEKEVNHYIKKHPGQYDKLLKHSYFILKTLAHQKADLNIENPFADNLSEIYFLKQIAGGMEAVQFNLFDELELPELYNKYITIPEGYGDDPIVKDLFDQIENSDKSYFISGKAGTGKSTFIHYFARNTKKRILLTAFTGIAAINVGGETLHSFFLFPLKPLMPGDEEIKIFHRNSPKRKVIQNLDVLVIDEVSMLRSDILEAIDHSLRMNGGDPSKVFGGKQILFVGDIFQLPPVLNQRNEAEAALFKEKFRSHYFFDSLAFKELKPTYFEFGKVHRQKEDQRFVQLLEKVRRCEEDPFMLEEINDRYNPAVTDDMADFTILLTAHNYVADHENSRKLKALPYRSYLFQAKTEGNFSMERFPTSPVLELKKNAQIIFVKNDLSGDRRWVNGTIGIIDFISDDHIEVRLQEGKTYKIERETWENRRYSYDRQKRQIVSELVGTFTQFPIKLAWAITIHKSQGLSFDNVIIDLGRGAFVNGQAYTALSRCRRLSGITLRRRLSFSDLILDERIVDFDEGLNR